MLVISCIGMCVLFIIQFWLYKRKESAGIMSFIKSDFLLEIIKDFLIVLLGATLALNCTDYVESRQTKEFVIKLLEITRNDIAAEYAGNTFLLTRYNEGKMSAAEVKVNVQNHSELIDTVLENDTVMITMSPLMYYMILNNVRILNQFYDSLNNISEDEEFVATIVLGMNRHAENILMALDASIEHLKGNYTDQNLDSVYQAYLDRYEIIETYSNS